MEKAQDQLQIQQGSENIIQLQQPQDGFLYTWGLNTAGCLANQNEDQGEGIPFKVKTNQKFKSVSTGGFFGAAISSKNELYTWGETKNSRNGHQANKNYILVPQKIMNLQNISRVSCGNWHCLALNNQNQLYVTGHNKYGACGISGIDEINGFQLNDTIKNIQICSISAGDGFSLYLDINQQVYSSGFRQMHGNKEDQHQYQIKKIKELEGIAIKHINAGFCHSAVVTQERGEVYTWGSGNFYQLGHGNTKSQKTPLKINNLSGIEQVSCSRGEKYCHTTATSSDGKVYSWGSGYKGKLGHQNSWSHEDPADESRPRPIQYLQEKGIVIAKSISGGIHSAVLSQDGRLFTFGCGSDGRLGHIEAEKYVYLYREPFPREIQGPFLNNKIIDACSSYYFMAAIAES
ncbi:chromosome condensation regulator RCC1 repeat protein (macronuclear) [Tetrahymena thermophila SB210]|uniref:Chromosome condensation regulator RCC1 repeat protein n=1 Tax=Tetrahymena thermophila (strain SB210) TaxID=312017 RepID=I7LVS4_TETTS|nr:chromosome condensation regulator RCC1 repeat protein [Tetrahymena thermophila SB210]EAR99623.2 chromosome condensation regulator RCC1 repeat protein [Tetrahymena thermophila SB210]|eukprot:XP_001019868.2 chromosome condensation regulator RCC1 repeat protein [Tetrahymena thermophila SB210]